MSALSLELEPAEHWQDLSAALDGAMTRGLTEGTAGIAISGPPLVRLGVDTTLPLAGLRVASLLDSIRSPLYTALVISSCVETGEVRVRDLLRPPDETADDEGTEVGEGLTSDAFQLDLFAGDALPQRAATWVVRVVLREQISNPVTIRLAPPRARYQDPAAEELIRSLLRKPIIRALNPRPSLGPGLPSYERQPESPAIPQEPGIAIQVKRAQLLEAKSQLLLHGAFHANVLPRDVRPPPAADAPKLRGPRATAVVPMALVAIKSDRLGAELTPLVAPCYQPLEEDGDAWRGRGVFSFDYFQLTAAPPQARTLFLYAFAGALVSPVAMCALVDPKSIHEV